MPSLDYSHPVSPLRCDLPAARAPESIPARADTAAGVAASVREPAAFSEDGVGAHRRVIFDLIAAACRSSDETPTLMSLAGAIGVSLPTAARRIVELECFGLIRRLGDNPQKRRYRLVATGEETREHMIGRPMTDLQTAMLAQLRPAIEGGLATPHLKHLAKAVGLSCRAHASQVIAALQARGLIRREGNARNRIYIDPATGKRTIARHLANPKPRVVKVPMAKPPKVKAAPAPKPPRTPKPPPAPKVRPTKEPQRAKKERPTKAKFVFSPRFKPAPVPGEERDTLAEQRRAMLDGAPKFTTTEDWLAFHGVDKARAGLVHYSSANDPNGGVPVHPLGRGGRVHFGRGG